VNAEGKVDLISNMVKNLFNIDCLVVMGANLANEVAAEDFCEATIGSKDPAKGMLLKEALQTSYFRIVVVPDAEVVESCGALKVSVIYMNLIETTNLSFKYLLFSV
jgi:glycerol-3-phosphate dehydrogenase (NAD+)